ncbi:Methyltransferase type 11 [Methanocaldococcus vulcanius M7]|uniref:Methyltransferase type 11 n=1 Tax=Methanocaldococcus vulcanius (strain ATCC 700851 / DSM 12094 / M7) TaxID=579137 RepID=C9RHH0_METVM|nr:class I SAM-dependent methyltransferase [Methanocaldococcus vulcanius]ACX73022.1 Methyltransferase type 11 [Methanocaldococcus vulcanius M7]
MSGFEEYAEEYDRWFDENEIIYKSEIEALKRHIPKGKGLEIGVGTGRFAKPFNIKIGVDISKKMAEIAKKRGIDVIIARGEDLPFNDNEFDFVLINTVLEFSEDPKKMLKEAKRVLKNGGKIIIGIIDKDSFLGKMYEKKKQKSKFYKDANFLSAREVIEMLKELGFKNIKATQTIFKGIDKADKVKDDKNVKLLKETPSRSSNYNQILDGTLIEVENPNLMDVGYLNKAEPYEVKEGYGEGGFVAISAEVCKDG